MRHKLTALEKIEGASVLELLESSVMGGECVGICINPDCSYTTNVEPDCYDGHCEVCGTSSVRSVCALAGIC